MSKLEKLTQLAALVEAIIEPSICGGKPPGSLQVVGLYRESSLQVNFSGNVDEVTRLLRGIAITKRIPETVLDYFGL